MQAWNDEIYDALAEAGVRQIAYVPDAGHTRLIERCAADPTMRAVVADDRGGRRRAARRRLARRRSAACC